MCTPLPELSTVHAQVCAHAADFSDHLTPRTRAYHEIWLDQKRVAGSEDVEPIYGATYLPRKFKTAFVIPPRNDVDVLAHDLGYIAIVNNGELLGYNVSVAGGMGATHGDPATYPRLADVLCFITPGQVNEVGAAIVTIQRDYGDRSERKHARFKYTVTDRGLDWLREELSQRLGRDLAPPRPYAFTTSGDAFGWQQGDDGLWHLSLYIQNGRIADTDYAQQLTGLREIARVHRGEFRLTPNQNVIVAGIDEQQKPVIEALARQYGLDSYVTLSKLRLNAMACVAFPTCGLAMAEAERYLPDLLVRIEDLLAQHGLQDEAINTRMTGCPNGCARPYLAEIGMVGKAPGRYNLFLGAAHDGTRLNTLVAENIDEAEILKVLDEQLGAFREERRHGESFGDFTHRRLATPGTGESHHA
jgi:sulfite reductase (NADPH) hemoprotein beta-component